MRINRLSKYEKIPLFSSNKYPQIKQLKISLNNEYRNALLTPIPSIFEYEFKISKDDFLEFGIGVYGFSKNNLNCGFSFSVYIYDNEVNKILIFSKNLFPNRMEDDRKWLDVKIDLSQHEGNKKRIIFQTKKIGSLKNCSGRAVWSNPIIYRESEAGTEEPIVIFLISLDALRQDHLGCYGYSRNTTPNIDALAKSGVLFLNAFSQTHWTLPSHMSMFTSLYASSHNVYLNQKLDELKITFPEILKNHGFTCFGYASHFRLSPVFGFGRGFDYYISGSWVKKRRLENDTVDKVILKTMRFLTENRNKKKIFIFLHLFDIHYPYEPPDNYSIKFDKTYTGMLYGQDVNFYKKPVRNIFAPPRRIISKRNLEHIVALYDGEISNVDFYIGLLINHLKSLGMYNNSLIILTSDHGEELLDHKDLAAHNTIYDELLKVPLIIKFPIWISSRNQKINELVQASIDMFPTILDVIKKPIPPHIQGKSLLPLIMEKTELKYTHYNEIYAERLCHSNPFEYAIAIRTMKYKYIYTTHFDITNFANFQKHEEIRELYNIEKDPKEVINIVNLENDIADEFQEKIDRFVSNTLKRRQNQKKSVLNQKIKEMKLQGRI
ncbi:MAG: sulfatase [Promethearchaeota archaeon]